MSLVTLFGKTDRQVGSVVSDLGWRDGQTQAMSLVTLFGKMDTQVGSVVSDLGWGDGQTQVDNVISDLVR